MRVAILGGRDGWHASRLREAFDRGGHQTRFVAWGSVEAGIVGDAERFGPEPLAAADVVAVRGMPAAAPEANPLQQVIFRMDVLGRLEATGMPVINRPRALEIAIDKYLTLAMLADAGLNVPRTYVVQEPAAARLALEALGGIGVSKPLFGSGGRGLLLVDDAATAAAAGGVGLVYLQEFIRHEGWDLRILVVGDHEFAMRRVAREGEWRTNLACGGRAEPMAVDAAVVEVARRAAGAVGARIAGIDILPTRDGPVVLEVNAVPAWRGLQSVVDADVTDAIATEVLRLGRRGG
ncbi:MAG: RimK family alpha-L-glutamate ligase [Planctomycetes bacterium]|nr:RimK family alpha-L-glutamate ligase [Planctomycetota bacterium]